ncbi:hypothetical protein [Edaphobacter aggregans]|uniref:hypothetical protein n=1 Tax=Edaphobacter aggregans TaxID=570835 RepID=UPI000557DF6D|nr:hypothetical protein [Edaphobacter aggregans]
MSDTRKNSITALIFWLKNYGGMSDKLAVDASESPATAQQIEVVLVQSLGGRPASNCPPTLDVPFQRDNGD